MALAERAPALPAVALVGQATTAQGALGAQPPGNVLPTQAQPAEPVPSKRLAHDLRAVLIARIDEVFPPLERRVSRFTVWPPRHSCLWKQN